MTKQTAREKVAKITSGSLSAQSNVLQFLDKIKQENEKYNIFLHINEKALSQAADIDKRVAEGKPVGKLAGLGIALKSNICVDGLTANCASKTLENYTATYNADVVSKIIAEDGIILGMVNMDEFACGASGENSGFGKTNNPAADGYITGGSSSGSAAAVAANFCDIALGSDTGGSIRNPASHCGIVGIKPSYGRVSRYGLIDMAMTLDQIGPLAHNVDDARLMLEVIAGLSENDASTADTAVKLEPCSVDSITIGTSPDFDALCTDKRILELVSSFVENPVSVALPQVKLAVQTYYPIVYVEMFSGTRKLDGRRYGLKIEESCGDEVLRRILGGREISKAEHEGKYYRTALAVKDEISRQMKKAFDTVDVLVLPTTPVLPHKFGDSISLDAMYAYDAFTIPANLAGICAGVVPIGTIDGVPVGLQVFAPEFREDLLLSVLESISTRVSQKQA